MSADSTEGRRYHVRRKSIDGCPFIEICVRNGDGQLVTRDHLTIEETRTHAAELILAAEA